MEIPDGALISRSSYIRAAEETGLIVPIGEWVLRTACLQALEWQRAGHPMCRVAVNLSARQLQQPDLAQKIEKILIETGLDPRLLGLEITEGALMGKALASRGFWATSRPWASRFRWMILAPAIPA